MEVFIAMVIGFFLGIIFCQIAGKIDGRLVIDGNDYFVAITTKTEELEKRKQIRLRVINRGRK